MTCTHCGSTNVNTVTTTTTIYYICGDCNFQTETKRE